MTVLPLLFIILPLIQVFDAYAHVDSANLSLHVGLSMLYMLVIPAFLPVHPVRLLGGRRARAGHAGARPDHPDPPRGVPRRQGARRASFRPSSSPTRSLASSSPPRPCLPIP